MKSFILLIGFLLFAGEAQSSHYRGGAISYKPNATSPYSVDFTFRLSFRRGAIYCDSYRVANSLAPSGGWSPSTWRVTRYYWSYYSSSSSGSANIYCSDFNAQEDWSEGNNSFTFSGGYSDDWWSVRITDGGDWISGITHSNPYDDMQLEAKVNRTSSGVFNNSSPVSSLPLTVYVAQGIPSVIKIPVEDPDGDIVRCRNATYQECYRGMCTYFPHGVLDEGNCILSYNGGGYVGQLFPIILKLEDFPSGTTQFDSSNSLGSVDLQFVVHVVANSSDTVRIQGGGSSGRLQVLHNGVWGTVCDDYWNMTNTHVVCRQLGFGGALSYHSSGGGSGQIWLDDVYCSGSESAIQQCTHRGWGSHNCGHHEDVFVSCYHAECSNYTVLTTSDRAASYRGITNKCDRYDMTTGWYRFMGDAGTAMATWCIDMLHCGTYSSGWMQGSHPTQADGVVTRRVCYSYGKNCCWQNNNIRVRNCGGFYVYELVKPPNCYYRYCGNGNSTNNACASSPCRNGGTCATTYNGYRCYCPNGFTGGQCETDTVRIEGGGSSGRIQVLHNGVWGTVCDDYWNMTNTHVVCRQLGFDGALYYTSRGGGSGQIWLDDVRCYGSESAIQQCTHRGWGSHNCGHYEDVFVSCYPTEFRCSNYTVLNPSDRAASYRGITYKCDRNDITPGWYRFMGDAGTVMPTWCIDSYHCGTYYPGWMNGSHPTQADGVVTRRVCYSYSSNCCYWNNNIQVRNCGGFYVYELVRPPTCNLRYCGNGNSTNNTCTSSPCRNSGTCATTYNGYRCYCPSGYTGRQCEAYVYPCNSNPCRNGGTCNGGYGWYRCSCRYGYTGQQCQSYVNFCANWPCRNGGTCTNNYNHGYNCSCPFGFTGPQCETNLKTSVTCGENFMQIDLLDHYFPGLDWRTLHLKNTTCRATKTAYTMRLRAPLDGCGVTYVEHDKKITFWNEVRNELVLWPGWGGNLSAITRGENLVIPFFCEYGREKIVSTNFSPSKKRVYASEGSYGNFTFTMDLYYTSSYRTPYSVFAYPVVVYPNQPLWVQYEVKNTNADLVVFAENCRATTTTNPDSFPQHVFLKRGCVRDPTMVYWYNPYSNVQRFSIKSFRFVYSNKFLVYLHCELIVCHRNSTNSRCAQGCISGSRRRREADAIDGSNTYRLSAGPLKGPQTGTDQQGGEETSSANTATIGSVSALAVVGLLVAIVLSIKMYHARRNRVPPKETPPPAIVMGETLDMSQTVNSYEQHVMEDGERMEIEI